MNVYMCFIDFLCYIFNVVTYVTMIFHNRVKKVILWIFKFSGWM